MTTLPPSPVLAAEAGHTLAKVLRSRLHEHQPSWADVRALVAARRVRGRRCRLLRRRPPAKEGRGRRAARPAPATPAVAHPERLVVRHLDEHVVVVEKPAGVNSVRHPLELAWSESRRGLDPTLQDLAQWAPPRG